MRDIAVGGESLTAREDEMDINKMAKTIGEWAEANPAFADHTNESIARHLMQKAEKLRAATIVASERYASGAALEDCVADIEHHGAGVFVLLATLFHRNSLDLGAAIAVEHAYNLRSEWAFDPRTNLVQRKKADAPVDEAS